MAYCEGTTPTQNQVGARGSYQALRFVSARIICKQLPGKLRKPPRWDSKPSTHQLHSEPLMPGLSAVSPAIPIMRFLARVQPVLTFPTITRAKQPRSPKSRTIEHLGPVIFSPCRKRKQPFKNNRSFPQRCLRCHHTPKPPSLAIPLENVTAVARTPAVT